MTVEKASGQRDGPVRRGVVRLMQAIDTGAKGPALATMVVALVELASLLWTSTC